MKRWLAVLALVVTACVAPRVTYAPGKDGPLPPTSSESLVTTPAASPSPAATAMPAATFTPTPEIAPSPTFAPEPELSAEDIQLFPWPVYAGDRISVDVAPRLPDWPDSDGAAQPWVTLAVEGGEVFTATVAPAGLAALPRARFYWIAEMSDTAATTHLTVTLVLPDRLAGEGSGPHEVILPVDLRPRDALPPPEPWASWVVTETEGLRFHYLSGSAAERDLLLIIDEGQKAYADIAGRMGALEDSVDIYLLDRIIGQGGYASKDWVAIAYTDRRHAPLDLGSVLRHELTHPFDDQIGCDEAPALVREGLAVTMAGGHYGPESLRERAAALVSMPSYVPLADLVDGFYTHQHEVAYLEAGSLMEFIIERHDWEGLVAACRASSSSGGEDHVRLTAAVGALGYDGITGLEQAWQDWLRPAPIHPHDQVLLDLEIRLMDAMRTYQAICDRPAHFLEGILFSPAEGEQLGIVADFVRRPRRPEAVGLELVLAMAQETLAQSDPLMLEALVEDVEIVLSVPGVCEQVSLKDDGTDFSESASFVRAAFVREAMEISEVAGRAGWEPYRLLPSVNGRYLVYALDYRAWPRPLTRVAQMQDESWLLSEEAWGQ